MLPIENPFNMYPYYPQYHFSMFPPCFYYPSVINHTHLASVNLLESINVPELHASTSESSAEPSG